MSFVVVEEVEINEGTWDQKVKVTGGCLLVGSRKENGKVTRYLPR